MNIVKGYEYYVDGHEDIVEFAKGILALVNARSSRRGTVLDVRTFDGLNQVEVITMCELDKEIEHFMGKITSKKEIKIANLDRWDDGNPTLRKKMDKLNDEYLDNDDGIETIYFFEHEDID
jgi:hypothetical protein